MEPAIESGSTNGTDYQFGQGMLPQWSPLVTGGNAYRADRAWPDPLDVDTVLAEA